MDDMIWESIMKYLAKCNVGFGIDLFMEIYGKTNTFFSPVSVSLALAMVRTCAINETRDQLTEGLYLYRLEREEYIEAMHKYLIQMLNDDKRGICVIKRMYVGESIKFSEKHLNEMREVYGTELEAMNFGDSVGKTVHTINKQFEELTDGRITNVIKHLTVVNDAAAIILVNAICFKGAWMYPFDVNLTKQSPFFDGSLSEVISNVDMMTLQNTRLLYDDNDHLGCKTISLPYADSGMAMLLILPAKHDGLDELLEKLSIWTIRRINKDLTYEIVTVKLPKFGVQTSYELSGALKKLGVELPFSSEKAELSLITGKKGPHVTSFFHKTYLSVDEYGTDASTVAVPMMGGCHQAKTDKFFIADRPFFFVIQDSTTKVPLFMGSFRNPLSN